MSEELIRYNTDSTIGFEEAKRFVLKTEEDYKKAKGKFKTASESLQNVIKIEKTIADVPANEGIKNTARRIKNLLNATLNIYGRHISIWEDAITLQINNEALLKRKREEKSVLIRQRKKELDERHKRTVESQVREQKEKQEIIATAKR